MRYHTGFKEQKEEVTEADILYKDIELTLYPDVINMTEDEFLRLTQFKDWGRIGVYTKTGNEIEFAQAMKDYNPDIYNKYKLMFTEYETTEKIEDEEEDVDDGDDYDYEEDKHECENCGQDIFDFEDCECDRCDRCEKCGELEEDCDCKKKKKGKKK